MIRNESHWYLAVVMISDSTVYEAFPLQINQPDSESSMERLKLHQGFAVFRPKSKPVPRVNQVFSLERGYLQVVYLSVYFNISP